MVAAVVGLTSGSTRMATWQRRHPIPIWLVLLSHGKVSANTWTHPALLLTLPELAPHLASHVWVSITIPTSASVTMDPSEGVMQCRRSCMPVVQLLAVLMPHLCTPMKLVLLSTAQVA